MDGIKSKTEKQESYSSVISFIATSPKESEAQNDFREDFLNIISHELKTPLTSLKAYTQFLLKGIPADDKAYSLATKIYENALRLQDLTQNLLEAGQISSGNLEVRKNDFAVADFLTSTVDRFRQPNHRIVVGPMPDITLTGDVVKLERAMVNVLSNAVKFSPADSLIEVNASVYKGTMQISVKDNGFGINTRDQARIFEQFYRADTTSINQGLGLGLFIADAIVKAHGGYMYIESELGRGSTFSIIIPVAESDNPVSEKMQLDHYREKRHIRTF